MVGIYFSGTGNSKYAAELFCKEYDNESRTYSSKLKVDTDKCIGCGLCEKLCPMKNIAIKDQKAVSSDRCTMCYRCVNKCPGQALTLLGKRVVEQCGIEKYI